MNALTMYAILKFNSIFTLKIKKKLALHYESEKGAKALTIKENFNLQISQRKNLMIDPVFSNWVNFIIKVPVINFF